MGLFDLFKKKEPEPKKTIFNGYLWIIKGLNKKYENAEVFKLGKTILTELEKEELIKKINDFKGQFIFEFDQQKFADKTTLESNNKIFLMPFLAVEDLKFRATYKNDVLKRVAIYTKKDESFGTVTTEADLKRIDGRLRTQMNKVGH